MHSFLVYYLISTGYMVFFIHRYRNDLIKHYPVNIMGIELTVITQLITGFLIAPIILFLHAKILFYQRKVRISIMQNKKRREAYHIEFLIPEDEIVYDELHDLHMPLSTFVDNVLFTIDKMDMTVSECELVAKNGNQVAWLRNGDPHNLLQSGYEIIVKIKLK